MERETGVEPATLSLGMPSGDSAPPVSEWQTSENPVLGDRQPASLSPELAGIRTREAPIEPQRIARDPRSAQDGSWVGSAQRARPSSFRTVQRGSESVRWQSNSA